MRSVIVGIVLVLLFLAIRANFADGMASRDVDPVLVGYFAIFAAGIVLAEVIRPVLTFFSPPVRFAVVAVVAALSYAGYQYIKDEAPVATAPTTTTVLSRSSAQATLGLSWDGHFRGIAHISGHDLGIMVDTGSPLVMLRYDEARRIGIDVEALEFDTEISTAAGRTIVALVQLKSVQIDGVVLKFVDAAVAPEGTLQSNLIGMSFLSRIVETVVNGETMSLRN